MKRVEGAAPDTYKQTSTYVMYVCVCIYIHIYIHTYIMQVDKKDIVKRVKGEDTYTQTNTCLCVCMYVFIHTYIYT